MQVFPSGRLDKSVRVPVGSNRFLPHWTSRDLHSTYHGLVRQRKAIKDYDKPKHDQIHVVSTWTPSSFEVPFIAFSTPYLLVALINPPLMSSNRDRYRVFEVRAPDEEHWSTREELFNAYGYNFRPRLRREWVPSWHTTGISPLHSEDGEISKVL